MLSIRSNDPLTQSRFKVNKYLLVSAVSIILFACSSKEITDTSSQPETTSNTPDGSVSVSEDMTDASTDTSSVKSTPAVVQSCLDKCTTAHPKGVKLAAAIDQCWSLHCKKSCLLGGDPSGKVYSPDAGDPDASTTCKTTVLTPFQDCSDCTQENCCAPWDACFGDPDGLALNECSNNCWNK